MTRAYQVVYRLSKKYGCKTSWIWELIEENFNMRKGQGALLDPAEVIQLEEIIEELIVG